MNLWRIRHPHQARELDREIARRLGVEERNERIRVKIEQKDPMVPVRKPAVH
jgi:hypothetical protein